MHQSAVETMLGTYLVRLQTAPGPPPPRFLARLPRFLGRLLGRLGLAAWVLAGLLPGWLPGSAACPRRLPASVGCLVSWVLAA